MKLWEKVKRAPVSAYRWVRRHVRLVLFFIASLLIAETATFYLPHVPPTGQTVETRWMINGQTSNASVWWLNASISGTAYQTITVATGVAVPDYVKFGIKAFIGFQNGTRELVSGASPVALAQYNVVEGNNNFEVSGTWAHSAIARSNMANISVEVFADKNLATPTTLRATYSTENITNLSSISGDTWTVYYNGREAAARTVAYRWGDSSIFDTRITNFGYSTAEYVAPQLGDFFVNATWAGDIAQFSFNWTDNTALNAGIFGCNVTGTFVNDTAVALSGAQAWFNVTKTLPSTPSIVQFQASVNDTSNNWGTTGIRYLKVYQKTAGLNNTYYMRGDTLLVNQWNLSRLDTSQGAVTNHTTPFTSDIASSSWMLSIYVRNWVGSAAIGGALSQAEITSTGMANVTFTKYAYNFTNLYDTLQIDVKGDPGSAMPSTVRARFIAPITKMAGFNQSNWTVHYYIEKVLVNPSPLQWNYTFYWGNATYDSKLESVTYNAWNPSYIDLKTLLTDVNGNETWTDVEPYIQTILSRKNETDLETMIENYAASANWLEVLRWSAFTKKLGVYNQTVLRWALGNFSMAGSLPVTHPQDENSFSPQDRWALYGFWWAVDLNANLTKWNITAAFGQYNRTVFNYGRPLRLMYANESGYGADRYYDEFACTISGYIFFEEILNITGGLNMAKYWWDGNDWAVVQCLWNTNPDHFNYNTPPYFGHQFEVEGASFVKIMSTLKYYDSGMTNWTKVTTDVATRFLDNSWQSYQWLDWRYNDTKFFTVHAWSGNEQVRTKNTIITWFTLLGIYPKLNSTYQQKIREMLYGNQTVMPYWILTTFREGHVWSNGKYAWGSDVSSDANASAYMMVNLFMTGIVPGTTSIAFPLEEMDYEHFRDIDPDMFQFNLTTRTIRIAVYGNGTLTFQYGTSPVTYNFTGGQGIYEIKFTPSWNLITSAVRISDIPSSRLLFSGTDSPPTYSTKGATSNIGGTTTTFYCLWQDDFGLAEGTFGTNNTGQWQNETVTVSGTASWANVTKTLNATQNAVVQYRWWVKDNGDQWTDTGLLNLTVYYYTNMTVGWTNFSPYTVDVGHTLAQVNSSLISDGLSWIAVILQYTNGTRYAFVYGSDANADVPVAGTTDLFYVYCDVAGTWFHNYP